MKASLVIRTERGRKTLRAFAANSRKNSIDVVKGQAKLFVRDSARVTPPAQGSLTGAKQRGEATVRADLAYIFVGLSPALLKEFEEFHGGRVVRRQMVTKDGRVFVSDEDRRISDGGMAAFHRRQRVANGRVTSAGTRTRDIGRSRSHVRGVVSASGLRSYQKKMLGQVGILSAGWNAAARGLGLSLPAWITRHGTSGGALEVRLTLAQISVRVRNRVSFNGQVKGLERRVRYAYRARAIAMERQLKDYALKKAARDAGIRVSGS